MVWFILSAMATVLLLLIYLAFISLGLPDSLLGSGWPAMHLDFEVSVSSMGIITMVISGCTILSSLFADFLTRKLGTGVVTVGSVFLTVLGLFGFSFSSQFWMLICWALPYGLGAGAIDASLNSFVATHYKARHMSWLHCFWGVDTIASPFIMGYSLANSSWRNGYRIVGFLQLGIAVLLLATLPLWKKVGGELKAEEEKKKISVLEVLKTPGVLFLFLGFFAYCAAEATTMQWASTYFVEAKGIGSEQAANFASLFYIGIAVGRFLFGFFSEKLGDGKCIAIGGSIALTFLVLLALPTPSYWFAVASFVGIGFGFGPIYPCLIHATPLHYGKEKSGSIIGMQMACAYVGSTFMPPLFGLLGNGIGFQWMPFYLLFFFAVMALFVFLCFQKAKTIAKE